MIALVKKIVVGGYNDIACMNNIVDLHWTGNYMARFFPLVHLKYSFSAWRSREFIASMKIIWVMHTLVFFRDKCPKIAFARR